MYLVKKSKHIKWTPIKTREYKTVARSKDDKDEEDLILLMYLGHLQIQI